MKRVLYIIFAVVIILNLNSSDLIAERQRLLIVRVDANYPPYEMVVDGKLTGLHIDLVYAVAKQLDTKVKFKSVPWNRAIKMVKNGNADAITYIGKTPEREGFISYNDGNILSSSAYGFITLKSKEGKIKYNGDIKSMRKYKIGVQRGYSYGTDFDNAKYLKRHAVDKVNQMLNLLSKGRIDLAVVDEPEYLQNRNSEKWNKITFLKQSIQIYNLYIIMSASRNERISCNNLHPKGSC